MRFNCTAGLQIQRSGVNGLTVSQLDKTNFESNARCTLYGCYLGGSSKWTDQQIEDHAWGQRLANYLGIRVKAFTGGGGGSMKVGANGKNVYDGQMTRFTERKSGVVKQSTFKKGQKPNIVR